MERDRLMNGNRSGHIALAVTVLVAVAGLTTLIVARSSSPRIQNLALQSASTIPSKPDCSISAVVSSTALTPDERSLQLKMPYAKPAIGLGLSKSVAIAHAGGDVGGPSGIVAAASPSAAAAIAADKRARPPTAAEIPFGEMLRNLGIRSGPSAGTLFAAVSPSRCVWMVHVNKPFSPESMPRIPLHATGTVPQPLEVTPGYTVYEDAGSGWIIATVAG